MEKRQGNGRLTRTISLASPRRWKLLSKSSSEFISDLCDSHPLLVWAGIWTTVLLVGAIAVGGLVSPSISGGHKTSGAAFGSSTNAEIEPVGEKNQSAFWIFGAITLSCTAGSILVSKRLHHTQDRFQPPAPFQTGNSGSLRRIRPTAQAKRRKVQPETRTGRRSARTPKRLKPFTEADFLPPILPQSARIAAATPKTLPPAPPRSLPQHSPHVKTVTVIPAEASHPLDWQEESLADTMDIRKRRSLSSWL